MRKIILAISTAFHLKIGKDLYLVRLINEGTYKEQFVLEIKEKLKCLAQKRKTQLESLCS